MRIDLSRPDRTRPEVQAAAFDPTSRRVALALPRRVVVYDAATGALCEEYDLLEALALAAPAAVARADDPTAFAIAFTPDGRRLVLHVGLRNANEFYVHAFERPSGRPCWLLHAPGAERPAFGDVVIDVAVAPDARVVAFATLGGECAVHDAATGALVADLARVLPRELAPRAVAFDPSGRVLAVAGGERLVRVDWAGARLVGEAVGLEPVVDPQAGVDTVALRFSPDGATLVAAVMTASGPFANVIDLAKNRRASVERRSDDDATLWAPLAISRAARSVLWAPDAAPRVFAFAQGAAGQLVRQHLRTGALRAIRRGPRSLAALPAGPALVAVAPDGRRVARVYRGVLQLTALRRARAAPPA